MILPKLPGQPQDQELVGRRLREYEVLELVGRGGMGAVYRARHVLLDEERAIKIIHPGVATQASFAERFIREARMLARLRNDHVVRLYEFWDDSGTLYMALEFLHGESLAQRLARLGRLAVGESLRIARQAASGLAAAHAIGVVHRDISPDNLQLVVSQEGEDLVKVMDFGIAKAVEETQHVTANVFLGKFEYASPEQCGFGLAPQERIDGRSDVYSLGVTLFRMLTGRLPFEAATPQAYLLKHTMEAPPAPSTLVGATASWPPELDRLVLKALAKERAARQQTMQELIAELNSVPELEKTADAGAPTVITQSTRPAHTGGRPAIGNRTTSTFEPGARFAGKYRIEGKLGEGGMGIVFRATDTILDEPVALKIIGSRLATDPSGLDRLKREVVLARRVAHPNVCRIHDIGEAEGVHYVSMELIDGEPLSRVLKGGRQLSLPEGVPLMRQLLDGLAAAHQVGVVHRDLKPDNMMITREGHAVIMDFGLSLAEDIARVTRVDQILGTPHYMAPEQIRGAGVDARADLYAVGAILFRVFTGRNPFEGDHIAAVIHQQLTAPPPRPSTLALQVTPLLEEVILKALAKEPAARHQTALELLEALDPLPPARVRTSAESGRVARLPSSRERSGTTVPPSPPARPSDQRVVRDWLRSGGSATETAPVAGTAPEVATELQTAADAARTAPARPVVPARREQARALPRPQPRGASPRLWLAGAGLAAVLGVAVIVSLGGRDERVVTGPDAGASPEPLLGAIAPTPVGPPSPAAAPHASLPPITTPTPTARPTPVVTPSPEPVRTPPPTPRPTPSPTTTPVPTPRPTPSPMPRATPTPAPTALPTPVPSPVLSPEAGVRQALQEYGEAFSRRDLEAVRRIYPTVPDRNFQSLVSDFRDYLMRVEVKKLDVKPAPDGRVLVEARVHHRFTTFDGKSRESEQNEKMVFLQGPDGVWRRVQ